MKLNEGKIFNRINSKIEYFSKTDQKIANAIIYYPKKIINNSMRESADDIGISHASLIRFAKNHLNLDGYSEMQFQIAVDYEILKRNKERSLKNYKDIEHEKIIGDINKIFNNMFNYNSKFKNLYRKISNANFIYIIDFTMFPFLGEMLDLFLSKQGYKCKTITEQYKDINIKPDNLIISIAKNNLSKELVQLISKSKADKFSIVNHKKNELLKYTEKNLDYILTHSDNIITYIIIINKFMETFDINKE
ncbi:MAG: MurR/RpiR family transcriptional regulator [bacterium]